MNQLKELEETEKLFKKRRKCPICGKYIGAFLSPDYGWKLGNKVYCSYTCMRVDEKKAQEALQKKLADDLEKHPGKRKKK